MSKEVDIKDSPILNRISGSLMAALKSSNCKTGDHEIIFPVRVGIKGDLEKLEKAGLDVERTILNLNGNDVDAVRIKGEESVAKMNDLISELETGASASTKPPKASGTQGIEVQIG